MIHVMRAGKDQGRGYQGLGTGRSQRGGGQGRLSRAKSREI